MSETQPPWETGEMILSGPVLIDAEHSRMVREAKKHCTCHPDDNPPNPCAEQYAYSDCVRVSAPPLSVSDADVEAALTTWLKTWCPFPELRTFDESDFADMRRVLEQFANRRRG